MNIFSPRFSTSLNARRKRIVFLCLMLPLLHGCLAIVAGGAVATGAGIAHDRRGTNRVIVDRRVAFTAEDAINRDPQFVRQGNYIKPVVYNGTLLLCGQVRSAALKQHAQTLVEHLEGVVRVVNEVEVVEEPRGFWRRRQDNAMAARVKAALLDITSLHGFDPLRVNVTVVNGAAYLMGFVSHDEADAVVAIVRNVGGIERVVKVFEYAEPGD